MKTLALALGDPNGIGPEIVLKTLQHFDGHAQLRFKVYGPAAVLARTAAQLGLSGLLSGLLPQLDLIDAGYLADDAAVPGQICAAAGASAVAAATAALRACRAGEVDAVVAAPHHETAISLAGIAFSGYPSLVARVCGVPEENVFLMLVGGGLRIVHVTLHESVRTALGHVTPQRVAAAARAGVRACGPARCSGCHRRPSACSASTRMRRKAGCSAPKTRHLSHLLRCSCARRACASMAPSVPTCCCRSADTTFTSRCCTTRATSR
jgi:4-hydroxy-L-threonine phosphate dehydrogenase PdxA